MRGISLLTLLVVTACGSASGSIAPTLRPSPVTPRQAAITISGSFTPFKNQYGDPLEALNLHITSNLPVPFKVWINWLSGPSTVLHNGCAEEKCVFTSGCLVNPRGVALDDFYCDNACPAGTYVFHGWVCSYNSDEFFNPCRDQPAEYLAWVGKLGVNLSGNPNPKPDEQHPAILNLNAEASVTHS